MIRYPTSSIWNSKSTYKYLEKYILIATTFHMILIFFSSKFMYLMKYLVGKCFLISSFAKVIVYCSLPCSEFCSKYITFMTVLFISKNYSKNLAWLNLFLEHALSFCYSNLLNRFHLLTVMMHKRSYRNPAPWQVCFQVFGFQIFEPFVLRNSWVH